MSDSHLSRRSDPSDVLPVVLAAGLAGGWGVSRRRCFGSWTSRYLIGVPKTWRSAGYGEVLIVTGHESRKIESHWAASERTLHAEFVYNPRFADLNNFHSLAVAIQAAPGRSLLVLNSDIVFRTSVVERVASNTPT